MSSSEQKEGQDAERALRDDIKRLIVTALRLESIQPGEIDDDELLFSDDARLKLDSLSALELLSELEFVYKIRFGDDGTARKHFRSVSTLAAFVASTRG